MKMKRVLSLLLALVMLMSLIVVPARAEASSGGVNEDENFYTKKSISGPDSNGNYTLTLEAYAKGETVTTTTEKHIPADIVLVLDTSGSMDGDISHDSTQQYIPKYDGYSYDDVSSGKYYYRWTDGQYYPVIRYRSNGGDIRNTYKTWLYFVVSDTRYYLSNSGAPIQAVENSDPLYGGDRGSYKDNKYKPHRADNGAPIEPANNGLLGDTSSTIWTGTLYQKSVVDDRMKAMKIATSELINQVYDDAVANDLDHKISIVEFASSANVKNNSASVKTEKENLMNTVARLDAGGATRADLGMTEAKNIINGVTRDSNKVVVFLTDGYPTSSSGFEVDVAAKTVNIAKDIKAKASVYSIALLDSADPSAAVESNIRVKNNDDTTYRKAMHGYMHGVSSNYPAASATYTRNSSYSDDGYLNITYGTGGNKGYYQKGNTAASLADIFKTIAEQSTTGGAYVMVDKTAVLTDIVTDDFTIPNGVESVKVYTANCTGKNDDSLTFGNRQLMTNANVNVSGNTLTVTNFDYSANWCGSHSGPYDGKKLIVELTIKPTQDAVTELIVPTNTTNSAVSDENNTYEFKFVPPEVETANYTVNYYKTGTTTKLKDSKTVGRYFPGVNVTENAVDIPGYTVVGDTSKSLKIAASGNEINFYYAPVDYTITYDYNDGTTEDKTTGYTVEDTLTIEAAPTRDHYKFNGWKVTENVGSWVENATYNGGESLTKQYGNVKLEAQWTELYGYALNFHKNLGTKTDFDAANMPDNQPETWEEVGTKTYTWTEVPTRTAYTFTGWSETADGTPLSGGAALKSYSITGKGADLVKKDLYAQWEANSYTITYDANGGTVTPASEDYTVEDKLIIPVPTREGYTFNGWKVETVAEEGNWTVGEAVNTGEHASGMYGDVTLKADWIINRSTLQVDPNGGTWKDSESKQSFTQDYNTTKDIPNPTRTGYDFVGWTLSGDENGSFNAETKTYTFGPAKDKTDVLTAQWREKTATIKYEVVGPDGCGSVDPAIETVKVVTGPAIGSTATASSNNYKFVGWYSDPECTKLVSSSATFVPTKADGDLWVDTTYYAKFDWNVADLTITKKAAQGTTFDEGQSFVFHVTDDNDVDMYVTVQGEGSVIVKDLLVGDYTVTEVTDWSWRYTPDKAEKDVTVEGGKTNTVEFINERTNNKWLSDDVTCVNTSDTTCDTFSAN